MTTLHGFVPEKLVEQHKSAGEPAAAAAAVAPVSSNDGQHHYLDAASTSEPNSLAPESLSSASSFQSLASTLSSKSSSGICVDSAPGSPDKTHGFDQSYVNVDIPDLDDLISACANINLNSVTIGGVGGDEERNSPDSSSGDCSQDQTFASAADDTLADETQIAVNVTEESIQTFKTCPGLEATQILKVTSSTTEVLEASLPVADQSSSVIPYVSFEESVLRKHQDGTEDTSVFKSALTSFQVPSPSRQRQSYSPTPCVEIDVRTRTDTNDVSFTNAQSEVDSLNEKKEQENEVEVGSTNTTFEEGQALNSTVILNSELGVQQSNTTDTAALEKLNLTVSKTIDVCPTASLVTDTLSKAEVDNQEDAKTPNQDEIVIPGNDKVATQEVNASYKQQEENILNKTEVISSELNNLNITQDIGQEKNTLNETLDIVQGENNLNRTQDFVTETDALNRTQDFVQNQNDLYKIEDIVKETNNLNITQEIVHEENVALNKTQDIVHDKNYLNKTQEAKAPIENEVIVQKENNSFIESEVIDTNKSHKTETLTQNETRSVITVNALPEEKEESLKHNIEEQNLKLNTQVQEEQQSKLLNHKAESPIKSKISVRKDFELLAPNHCEAFTAEETQNSNLSKAEVVASTPLPAKSFNKSETPNTPKSKSALFTETKSSRPQSPQVLNQSANTQINREVIKQEEIERVNFDDTVPINKFLEAELNATEIITKETPFKTENLLTQLEPEYEAFKPQQQSTTLPFPTDCDFRVLQEAALSVAKDIDASLEREESEQFVSATTELFGDPSALDFLNQLGSQNTRRAERYDSLYMKFDPLAQRLSMLPQKNLPSSPPADEEEEKETKVDAPLSNIGTPKKNPALAAIDRLLFYSPCAPSSTETEVAEAKQKKEEPEKQEPQPVVPVVDEKMAKELELVRSTVLQLEGELEKQKQEHKEQLERQKAAFEDKVVHIQTKFSQMQSQLTQEIKCKDQMTVVVEEYEKSISRLIAEREKDRQNFEVEKAKLQEELQIANQHLSNTEAAFSDVHSKYERLKNVVSAYKSNEEVLKESIAQNKEVIETLEKRYETLKSHAMAQLEKANQELSAIRKHNEAETVKLKALLRKAELKSKSLEETVEQKLKENQELTKIIDEMIARVE